MSQGHAGAFLGQAAYIMDTAMVREISDFKARRRLNHRKMC